MLPDLETFIKALGYGGVWGIVFAESGLLVGFFLPGDSLLFTAGFLASQGFFDISILIVGCFLAAVLGDNIGYTFGHRVGKKLFKREGSLLFHKDNLIRAQNFYLKHGKKTIILARFIPVVRTFAPIVAGVGDMEYRVFVVFNIIGALLWAVGVTAAGYVLGTTIPDVDNYLLPIVALIIISSIFPNIYHIAKDPVYRRQLTLAVVRLYRKIFVDRVAPK